MTTFSKLVKQLNQAEPQPAAEPEPLAEPESAPEPARAPSRANLQYVTGSLNYTDAFEGWVSVAVDDLRGRLASAGKARSSLSGGTSTQSRWRLATRGSN